MTHTIQTGDILYVNAKLTMRLVATSSTAARAEKEHLSFTNVPGEFPKPIYSWVPAGVETELTAPMLATWIDDNKTAPVGVGRDRKVF